MPENMMPQDVSDVELAFPARVNHLMPKYEDIPKEFRNWNSETIWNKLTSDWFYKGFKSLDMKPKEGIDVKKAMRHIRAILGSFEPKHEHKEAAVAYLLSQWFEEPKWEIREPSKT
jgi:hypothetical protein